MVFISFLFGEKITDFVIKKINDNLNTEISVLKADFSIFRRFPNAAVIFSEVVIKPNKDFTPDEAKHLNLSLIECKKFMLNKHI
ncbi:MAG: hypothetical protein HC905_13210 [Bacteroidales bacterium]|nr:hypothetical protein [Bacteroidales bacterium]